MRIVGLDVWRSVGEIALPVAPPASSDGGSSSSYFSSEAPNVCSAISTVE
jgi:hypothetical protein